jgi:hypothetical protein
MDAARKEIEADKDDVVGMLCCADDRRGFYEKCGWQNIDISVVRADAPAKNFFSDRNVMVFGESELPAIVLLHGSTF